MSEQSGNWTGGDATVLLRLATWFVSVVKTGDATVLLRLATWFVSVVKTGLVGQWGCYSLTAASYLVCVCSQGTVISCKST